MDYQALLQNHVDSFCRKHPAPNLVVGICQEGTLLASHSHFAQGFPLPASAEHLVFRIASMTKSFAAAAILRLRDEGLLSLDDSVAKYWKDEKLTRRWHDVTIAQLLSMTSGLPLTDDPWADRHLHQPTSFLSTPLLNEAFFTNFGGEEFQYPNLGYMVLGRIISIVSGQDALTFLADRFLTPLKMTETMWNLDGKAGVKGYREVNKTFIEEAEFRVASDLAVFGGLCTSLSDLTRWINFITESIYASPQSSFDHILSAQSRREMQRMRLCPFPSNSFEVPAPPSAYGYGLGGKFISDEWFVAHSGGLPGYGSHMIWSLAGDLGVMAMANVTYCPVADLCKSIIQDLAPRMQRTPPKLHSGADVVLKRGELLIDMIMKGSERLSDELFSHNFAADTDLERFREWMASIRKRIHDHSEIEILPERGFAGTLRFSMNKELYFSLSPVHGYRIQKIKFPSANR